MQYQLDTREREEINKKLGVSFHSPDYRNSYISIGTAEEASKYYYASSSPMLRDKIARHFPNAVPANAVANFAEVRFSTEEKALLKKQTPFPWFLKHNESNSVYRLTKTEIAETAHHLANHPRKFAGWQDLHKKLLNI